MKILDPMTLLPVDPDLSDHEQHRCTALRAHHVLGLIMQRVPQSTPIWRWGIQVSGIDIHVGALPSGHAVRATVMGLAEQFDLEYTERHHLDDKNIVAASGSYEDIPVKFWKLVPPCSCEDCGATL